MAIFINNKGYTPYAVQQLLQGDFKQFRPLNLIDQILTRFDFQNRRFVSWEQLEIQLRKDAVGEAIDISSLSTLKWKFSPFSAQFKKISISTEDNIDFLRFTSSTSKDSLQNEAKVLREIEQLGLRVVPIYGDVIQKDGVETMYEKRILGNFIDLYKEPFGKSMQITILGTFLGKQIPSGEAKVFQMKGIESAINADIKNGCLPSLVVLFTAMTDFRKIQTVLKSYGISDLQGILEFDSGNFYIADPLALVPITEILTKEKYLMTQAQTNVDNILSYLQELVTYVIKQTQVQAEKRKQKIMEQVIPLLPPPPSWQKKN